MGETFKLSCKDNEIIKKLIENHCAIGNPGKELDDALEDISHYQFIGLTVDNRFVICSTPHKIYAINTQCVNDTLKELLESDVPTKVIHGADGLAEYLERCHGIHLRGIFDVVQLPPSVSFFFAFSTILSCQ